jgi:hypothetical protein
MWQYALRFYGFFFLQNISFKKKKKKKKNPKFQKTFHGNKFQKNIPKKIKKKSNLFSKKSKKNYA